MGFSSLKIFYQDNTNPVHPEIIITFTGFFFSTPFRAGSASKSLFVRYLWMVITFFFSFRSIKTYSFFLLIWRWNRNSPSSVNKLKVKAFQELVT